MRDVLKAGVKVALATSAGLLGWVVAGKVIAITLGAAGVGLFGLLRQLLQYLTLLASLNGQTALVQGIASRRSKAEQVRFSGSVLRVQLLFSGIVAIGLLLAAPWLGPQLIPHPQATALLRWLAVATLATVSQACVIGVLNGHRLVDDLVKSQMLGPLAVLAMLLPTIGLIRGGHAFGFVLMLGGPAAVVSSAALMAARRRGCLPDLRRFWEANRADAVSFFRMSTVLLVAGALTTGTQFFLSWLVARRMGLAEVGQFWTAWTISMTYVTLVLGSFGTYYMPSLSRIAEREARRDLVRSYLRLSLAAMPLLVSLVIVLKPWAIRGMFSSNLLPAITVMRWMLIGDFFKGVSWVLAFPMLAFSDMKWFFWSESLHSLGMAGAAWLWLSRGGSVEALGVLFLLTYVIYLPVMVYYAWASHGFVWKPEEVRRFLMGLALVLLLSAVTWQDHQVRWLPIALVVLLGGAYSRVALRNADWRALRLGSARAALPPAASQTS